MNKRSPSSFAFALLLFAVFPLLFSGCGKNNYFANRGLPPSGLTNRVMIAVQNPSAATAGSLVFVDAFYDIRHPFNNQNTSFVIGGFSGRDPVTIQNLPEEQTGAVYSEGDGSFTTINYGTEKVGGVVNAGSGSAATAPSTSIFMARNQQYVLAANPSIHALYFLDRTLNSNFFLNVPNIHSVSLNTSGTLALGFVQNTDDVYSVIRLTQQQQLQYSNGPGSWPSNFADCEPQNLPKYCALRVIANAGVFDRPIKALFSADGQSIYVLNCGPECGGTQAGLVTIPLTTNSFNANITGPAGLNLQPSGVLPIPGGVTDAIQSGNTLYVAGQQLQPDGLFTGVLTTIDLPSGTIVSTASISDGNHSKMLFGDDSSLWIGSQRCQEGERYKQSQAGANIQFGCLTLYNTATGSVFIDAYKGDLTGVTAVGGLHKMYVAEGGQVHIYNTADGSERDNSNVTVTGTAYDVAYMDAGTDGDNANY